MHIISYSSDCITSIRTNVNSISKKVRKQIEFGNPEVYNTQRKKHC